MQFREIETELVVDVTGLPLWEGEPALAMVTYPSGRQYALRWETVWKHFVQLPDAGALSGVGGGRYDRPTKEQERIAQFITDHGARDVLKFLREATGETS